MKNPPVASKSENEPAGVTSLRPERGYSAANYDASSANFTISKKFATATRRPRHLVVQSGCSRASLSFVLSRHSFRATAEAEKLFQRLISLARGLPWLARRVQSLTARFLADFVRQCHRKSANEEVHLSVSGMVLINFNTVGYRVSAISLEHKFSAKNARLVVKREYDQLIGI